MNENKSWHLTQFNDENRLNSSAFLIKKNNCYVMSLSPLRGRWVFKYIYINKIILQNVFFWSEWNLEFNEQIYHYLEDTRHN